jgi:iron complex transport system substrate-binding protein
MDRDVSIPKDINRIIGLSPALTEILFYVCDTSKIVGRTQACNFPEAVQYKPVVNTYPLDQERLLALNPDLILGEEGILQPDQLELLNKSGASSYFFKYRSIDDVTAAMYQIAEWCDCDKPVYAKIEKLESRLESVKVKNQDQKTALGLVWQDPIYVYGQNTLFSDQMTYLGLQNAVDSVFEKQYPELSREYILKINPDIIIGSDFWHLDTTFFVQYPELKRINAYADSAIYDIEADLMTRPGPRIVEALEILKTKIYNDKQ